LLRSATLITTLDGERGWRLRTLFEPTAILTARSTPLVPCRWVNRSRAAHAHALVTHARTHAHTHTHTPHTRTYHKPAASAPTVHAYVNYNGTHTHTLPQVRDCITDCGADPACAGFTWKHTDAFGPGIVVTVNCTGKQGQPCCYMQTAAEISGWGSTSDFDCWRTNGLPPPGPPPGPPPVSLLPSPAAPCCMTDAALFELSAALSASRSHVRCVDLLCSLQHRIAIALQSVRELAGGGGRERGEGVSCRLPKSTLTCSFLLILALVYRSPFQSLDCCCSACELPPVCHGAGGAGVTASCPSMAWRNPAVARQFFRSVTSTGSAADTVWSLDFAATDRTTGVALAYVVPLCDLLRVCRCYSCCCICGFVFCLC
jgi:hypothetical protein